MNLLIRKRKKHVRQKSWPDNKLWQNIAAWSRKGRSERGSDRRMRYSRLRIDILKKKCNKYHRLHMGKKCLRNWMKM